MAIVSPWKQDFPVFTTYQELCYLDSAATCLTPKRVADAMHYYQCHLHANSHKGLYQLSANVTAQVEKARERIAEFIGASDQNTIVFTSGTTESINLIAYSCIASRLTPDSNIIISAAEHHANLLPWQRLCQQTGASLRVAPLDQYGVIDIAQLKALVDSHTALISISHSSNVIGKINPVQNICQFGRQRNIITVIDGAQAVCHGGINVEAIGCDFYVFSGHKIYGPTGCGVLYCRINVIDQMQPYQVGGGVIDNVTYESSRYLSGPLKLEAGSHNVIGIIGLVEAINYLDDIGWPDITHYLKTLSGYMQKSLSQLNVIKPVVPNSFITTHLDTQATPYLTSFQLDKVHSHDVASMLDSKNIAVRAGHHCAQPLHKALGINTSVRVSLGLYNERSDIDRLIDGLAQTHKLLLIE